MVYCSTDHLLAALVQDVRQLGDAGGLAGAVDAGHQDHGRPAGSQVQLAVLLRPVTLDVLLEEPNHLLRVGDLAGPIGFTQLGDELFGGADADVVADERLFELVQ
jgi:hypothetical protein